MESIEDMARLGIPADVIARTVERMALCETFTTTLFDPQGREYCAAYDVSLANYLASSRIQKDGLFNVVTRLVIDEPVKAYMHKGIYIEPGYLDYADISRPILSVTLFSPAVDFFIDGHHRLARAIRDGVDEIPIVALTPTEESLCQLFLLDRATLSAPTPYEDVERVALERVSAGLHSFPLYRVKFTA